MYGGIKHQGLSPMSSFFVFKSAPVILNRVPSCIQKSKTSTFDESIKFLQWLGFGWFQVVLGHFQIVLGCFRSFQVILNHFGSFLTLVSTIIRVITNEQKKNQQVQPFLKTGCKVQVIKVTGYQLQICNFISLGSPNQYNKVYDFYKNDSDFTMH